MKLFIFLLAFSYSTMLFAQQAAPVVQAGAKPESTEIKIIPAELYQPVTDSNFLVNLKGMPRSHTPIPKKHGDKQTFFYLLAGLFLTLGIMKNLYRRYFSTLFRVFFNTSLRQSQLTDQLEQAKLPSLVFNIFFAVTAGLYIFFLMRFYGYMGARTQVYLMMLCIMAVGLCYLAKFFSISFFGGWATDNQSVARSYVFIIFLVNKITGVILLPFLVLMAFSGKTLAGYAIFISVIILALLLLLRFYRAYSVLQSKLKITPFHFSLYVLALEIIPLAVIYKSILLFLSIST